MAAVDAVATTPDPMPMTLPPTPTTPWTTDNATAALFGMATAAGRPARAGSTSLASGRPDRSPTPGTPTPGAPMPAPGAPPAPIPGELTPGTARAAGPAGAPGVGGTLAASGVGASPVCAAGAACTPGADGGVSGIRTDATFWHPAPPLPHGPAAGSGVLTEVSGVTASVPPMRADATAPRTTILMTAPSGGRLAVGAGQSMKLRRTRHVAWGVSRNS